MLGPSQIRAFQYDGVTILRGVFSSWVNCLRRGVSAAMRSPSHRERSYEDDSRGPKFFNDFCNWQRFSELQSFIYDSNVSEIAAQLMDSRTARFFHDHILVKEPGAFTVTPWHQDQPYYPVEGSQSVSFWIPLDSIPKNRSIQFIRGSHRWEKQFKPCRFDGSDLFLNDSRDTIPSKEALSSENIVVESMKPGDAAAFSFRTFHRAPENRSKSRRRAISMRWVGDDAKFAIRLGMTSPDFSYLNYEDGDPFQGPDFPVIYKRQKED